MATRSKNLKTIAAQATTNNQSNKEDIINTNTDSKDLKVRYFAITLFKGQLIMTWFNEELKLQTKELDDLRGGLYAPLNLINKGVQPYFLSFNKDKARISLIKQVQEINKEDASNFFVEFVNASYTHFRIWRKLSSDTKAHLEALMSLTSTPATEVVAVVAEGDAFNTTTSCGHCGTSTDQMGLCDECYYYYEYSEGIV